MSCAYDCIKWLMFIFNLIFSLIGIAILAIGVWAYVGFDQIDDVGGASLKSAGITFMVIGVIIFVIAFFGCCGAVRESHCMVVTFAVFLLTILVVQVAIGVWAFILGKSITDEGTEIQWKQDYRDQFFVKYWTDEGDRKVVDGIQGWLHCCGLVGSDDFSKLISPDHHGEIPASCCGNEGSKSCTENIYQTGCYSAISSQFQHYAIIIGGVAVAVAVTELIGIIFAFCLANSIKNDYRRGYRV